MATDGVGVISADGKTVSYSVDVQLTGTGTVLDERCTHCGSKVLRRPAILGIQGTKQRPVIIGTCTNVHCTR